MVCSEMAPGETMLSLITEAEKLPVVGLPSGSLAVRVACMCSRNEWTAPPAEMDNCKVSDRRIKTIRSFTGRRDWSKRVSEMMPEGKCPQGIRRLFRGRLI